MQVFPIDDEPLISGELWAELIEDHEMNIITAKLHREGDFGKYSFLTGYTFNNTSKGDFNILVSPLATAKECLLRLNILKKMSDLKFRRFNVELEGENILKASCPKVNHQVNDKLYSLVKILAEFEDILQMKIGVPLRESDISKLIEEINGKEISQEQLKQLMGNHRKSKNTIIRMNLYENGNPIRLLTFQDPGWVKYDSFNLAINPSKVKVWKAAVRNQDRLQFKVYTDKIHTEFFEQFQEFNKQFFIRHLFREFNKQSQGQIKTQIDVEFKSPIEGSWDLVQEIIIKVERVPEDLIDLDKLLIEKQYVEAIPLMEKYKERFEVDLAYAYALNGEYKKSISLCNEILKEDFGSVAHMTKGLAYVGLNEFDLAFEAYQLGVHSCIHKWFPVAKENLEMFIQEKNIVTNEKYNSILAILSKDRKPLGRKKFCYCKSGRKFKNCHGRLAILN
ncbi:hypothetical protein [Priestia megaterium]|uniref:hypothetical protein n=1 Tax=Priestia megaterium TaxID=1404 RepID=UPI0030F3DD9D